MVTKIVNISINIDFKIMLMMMVWSTSISTSASKHPCAALILEYSRVFDTQTSTHNPKPREIISLVGLSWVTQGFTTGCKKWTATTIWKRRKYWSIQATCKKSYPAGKFAKYLVNVMVMSWLMVNMAIRIYAYVRYINVITHRGMKMGSLTISYNNPCFYHCVCAIAFVCV